jgi:hypothetical protein
MPGLADYLHSPAWWITAIVLAFLLNIVGNYAVRWIDRWGGQISTRRSTRTAAKIRRRAQLIAAVRADAGRLMWVGFQAQSLKTTSLLLLVVAFVSLAVAGFGQRIGLDQVGR